MLENTIYQKFIKHRKKIKLENVVIFTILIQKQIIQSMVFKA